MSTATHTNNGHAPPRAAVGAISAEQSPRALAAAVKHLELPCAFADTVLRYLLLVLPAVRGELAHWRTRAAEIPNRQLRETARRALCKRGNIEGAALFATLAPAPQRRRTVRAIVAFQSAYNYLDALGELPSADPQANGDQLHQALLTALHPGAAHPDYHAHNPDREDGGYLTEILDTCADAVAALPSFAALAPTARGAAARIVDFQALNLSESQGGHDALKRWATETTPPRSGLEWWETAAAAGSSLAVHALIAAAADPGSDPSQARAIDRAYFPWAGALHSLLDSLVDRGEDYANGQRSLLDYYRSPADAAIHLGSLATQAKDATQRISNRHAHRVILTAMCSYYLSAPESRTAEARTVTRRLTESLGLPLNVAILMFRTRRLAATITDHRYI